MSVRARLVGAALLPRRILLFVVTQVLGGWRCAVACLGYYFWRVRLKVVLVSEHAFYRGCYVSLVSCAPPSLSVSQSWLLPVPGFCR